jgi:pimeloyl-ACP methyl ester carboxylesterase
VLIHGFGANADTWRAIMTPLANSGYRVIAMDLLGYGDSEKPKELQMSMD